MFATTTEFAGEDDGELIRRLAAVNCDWLVALDLHREPEVWVSVFTALAEGQGRLVRIRPWRRQVGGAAQIAWLARFVIDGYEEWSRYLSRGGIRLIELGRAWGPDRKGILRPRHGFTVYQAYRTQEIGQMLQSMMAGPQDELLPVPPRRVTRTARGRRTPRTSADNPPA